MFADIKSFPFPTQSFTSFSLNLFNFIFIYLFILFFLIAAICLTNSTLSRLVARTVYWWPLRVKLFVQCLVSTPSRRVYLRPQVAVTCHLLSANIFSDFRSFFFGKALLQTKLPRRLNPLIIVVPSLLC